MSYDGILFDLDGVIRHWPRDLSSRIEARFGLPPGSIAGTAFEPSLLRQAVTGQIEDAAWRTSIEQALQERHGVAGIGEAWTHEAGMGWVDIDMLWLAERLRSRLKVGLLSNATTRLEGDLEALDISRHFDVICNSARLNLAKPDEEIFHRAAQLLGVAVERCIFVDDTPENVEAASRVGMTAIHFAGLEGLRGKLRGLGVLEPPRTYSAISFKPLEELDFSLIHQWRNTPHVLEWWHDPLTPEQVEAKYIPRITGEDPTRCYVIQVDGVPIGMIQTYRIGDDPEYAVQLPVPADAAGVDLYIGREDYLHRGLGSEILRHFLQDVVFPSGVEIVSIDPSINNRIAIRAYEKAGFRHLVTKQLPDVPDPTYLMTLSRAQFS